MAKLSPPPEAANEEALDTVRQAAASVGLDPERLVNLIVDSGLTAMPPPDPITERYTMEDLGKRLWASMQTMDRPARAEWFAKLTKPQQASIIVVLRSRGYRSEIIAHEFGIPVRRVVIAYNRYADKIGGQVVGLRLNTIAGTMQLVSERAQQMAMEADDYKSYWSIERDKVKQLQSLGIVDQAASRIEHTHRFDDRQKAEIEAMLDLERKKKTRGEELKQVEATVLDAVPEVEEDYDQE